MLTIRRTDSFSYELNGEIWKGRRGLIVVGPRAWNFVELAAHPKLGPIVWVRPGQYTVEMTHMRQSNRRALRISSRGLSDNYPAAPRRALERGRIYLHGIAGAILRPDHLSGCFGVGVSFQDSANGVTSPQIAMDGLMDALGGFREGRKLELEVGLWDGI